MSHTPGPWNVGLYRNRNEQANGVVGQHLAVWNSAIREGDVGHPVCLIAPDTSIDATDEANARLIAAAPELLEAAQRCLQELLTDYPYGEACVPLRIAAACEMARTAIEKAEGRQ